MVLIMSKKMTNDMGISNDPRNSNSNDPRNGKKQLAPPPEPFSVLPTSESMDFISESSSVFESCQY